MKNPQRYVAFIRGINILGRKVIKMDELKRAFEAMKFKNVKTLIASGNVIFETTDTDREIILSKINHGFKKSFGHEAHVIIRSFDEIQKLIDLKPFKSVKITEDIKVYVTLLTEEPQAKLKLPLEFPKINFRIIKISDYEVFSVAGLSPTGRGGEFMSAIEKQFGKNVTTRNWNTIKRLLEI